ncbi:MAG: Fur family transcriptional regulator [Candidatus Promineifilaceae bacterium]|nr:Fur family transcriptional regulator [Candidatus Promineifilaceae bacterium]
MERRLETLYERLQDGGYRLTEARQAILQALVESAGHISADELVGLLERRSISVGRMTVYRTLEVLSVLGIVRATYLGSGAAHYILIDDGHHHHLICSNCETVIEFEQCMVAEIDRIVGEHFDFEISGHLLEVFGRCSQCR